MLILQYARKAVLKSVRPISWVSVVLSLASLTGSQLLLTKLRDPQRT